MEKSPGCVKTAPTYRNDRRLTSFVRRLSPICWLNAFFDHYTGGPERPAFFDIDAVAPELSLITSQYPTIREELGAILDARASIPKYHELDILQSGISARVDKDKDWKVLMLYAMGERPAANRTLCPKTCELLDQIPNLFQAFFSILDPGKSVPLHAGPYRGYLRCHLGIKVPQNDPPVFRIQGEEYVWREGEAILFDDTLPHEVVNHARETRAILVVDVLRPMPPLAHRVNRLITYGAARLVYAKGILWTSALISRFSKRFLGLKYHAPRSLRIVDEARPKDLEP